MGLYVGLTYRVLIYQKYAPAINKNSRGAVRLTLESYNIHIFKATTDITKDMRAVQPQTKTTVMIR